MITTLITVIGLFFIGGIWVIGFYCFYEDQIRDKRRP